MNHQHLQDGVKSFYVDIWNRYDKTKIPELLHNTFTFRNQEANE
jgi:hypothetical protein